MTTKTVKLLAHSFIFLAVFSIVTGCGKGNGKDETQKDSLQVSLQIPEGEVPDLFWFGVSQRALEINKDGSTTTQAWVKGQQVDLDLENGDELTFRGIDAEGRVLVLGQAVVGKGKMISIPLRRVL